MKFLVVGIDYFTKWIEAEPLASITQQNVKNFVWKSILCRFRVPQVLVSDNGRQFNNALFRDFCEHFGIQNHYSSSAHPQANGQAEVANRSLLKIIKTRLEGAKGEWPDELPGVFRRTEQLSELLWGKPLSSWPMGARQLYLQRYTWLTIG